MVVAHQTPLVMVQGDKPHRDAEPQHHYLVTGRDHPHNVQERGAREAGEHEVQRHANYRIVTAGDQGHELADCVLEEAPGGSGRVRGNEDGQEELGCHY